jgi:transcription antitermination protein NusB
MARRTRIDRDGDRRSEARERALALLYETESKQLTCEQVLAALPVPPDPLATLIVTGVGANLERIDALIAGHAKGWTLARMAAIDRAVLRMATFELLERPEVPVAVVLDEAVELAKRFSTEDSGRFVNGVLSAVERVARARSR